MTPWQLAAKSEHSQQRALFAWANCAALFGFGPSWVAETYSAKTRQEALDAFNIAGNVTGFHGATAPVPALKLLFAVHNQGHGDAIRGARAKAEGVKAGVPDVMLPVSRHTGVAGYHGLFIELKRPGAPDVTKGAVRANQLDWIEELKHQGYAATVAVGWIEAAKVIERYTTGKPIDG